MVMILKPRPTNQGALTEVCFPRSAPSRLLPVGPNVIENRLYGLCFRL